jgi:hypothetical protein
VNFGQSTTLSWDVGVPANCSGLRFDLGVNDVVPPQGSRTLTPRSNGVISLNATWSGRRRRLATTSIAVVLPRDFTINANNLAPALRQALGTAGQIVRITNNVQLDLSGLDGIRVAQGVRLIGGRTAHQDGPLLFTKTRPGALLRIAGDGVRITGLRIRGPDMGVPGGGSTKAIADDSFRNLEVDNNEIYGWKGSAVEIRDNDRRISHTGTPTIRVHDNYLHHNQHVGRLGYGVVVSDGSFVLIERNVFDWNRHAIAGDGSDWSGYHAYDNLVLPNGGKHRWIPFPGFWIHTHQFDMHGQRNCGVGDIFSDALYNCGRAGHHMDVRYNAFLYSEKPAIKLRGTPFVLPCGVKVISNTFRHGKFKDAVKQTESGLCASNNQTGVNSLSRIRKCDVNGDGVVDNFLATGQSWWYASGTKKHWVWVRRAPTRPTTCPTPGAYIR